MSEQLQSTGASEEAFAQLCGFMRAEIARVIDKCAGTEFDEVDVAHSLFHTAANILLKAGSRSDCARHLRALADGIQHGTLPPVPARH